MAISNHERVGKGLDLLKDGLVPFVERELKAQHAQQWLDQVRAAVGPTQERLFRSEAEAPWDAASLLAVMWNQWNLVFRKTLGQAERTRPPAKTRSAGSSPRATAIHRGSMPVRIVRPSDAHSARLAPAARLRAPDSARLASAMRFGVRLEEVHHLFVPVPDHRRLSGLGARHDLAAAQHELAG